MKARAWLLNGAYTEFKVVDEDESFVYYPGGRIAKKDIRKIEYENELVSFDFDPPASGL